MWIIMGAVAAIYAAFKLRSVTAGMLWRRLRETDFVAKGTDEEVEGELSGAESDAGEVNPLCGRKHSFYFCQGPWLPPPPITTIRDMKNRLLWSKNSAVTAKTVI